MLVKTLKKFCSDLFYIMDVADAVIISSLYTAYYKYDVIIIILDITTL